MKFLPNLPNNESCSKGNPVPHLLTRVMIKCRTECGINFSEMDTLILKKSRPIPAMIVAM